MTAYRPVDDLWSPAGWLPVHRDQLRAKHSVISMGSLLYFRSTLWQSLLNKAGLKCPSVHMCVRMCIHTYVRPQSFFDFNEIWRVGRGRWVVHDGMQYDLIQGQGQGHEPFKVGNPAIFKSYLLHHLQWELATDRPRFLIFGLVFV